jgi:hypothetical protein
MYRRCVSLLDQIDLLKLSHMYRSKARTGHQPTTHTPTRTSKSTSLTPVIAPKPRLKPIRKKAANTPPKKTEASWLASFQRELDHTFLHAETLLGDLVLHFQQHHQQAPIWLHKGMGGIVTSQFETTERKKHCVSSSLYCSRCSCQS